MIISGIDEAGRGPVLGPMVISIFSIDNKYEEFLLSLGIKDSKKLNRKKREDLFEKFIENKFDFDFLIISPEEIDKNSLNKIFMEKVILFSNNKPSQTIYLDAPCHKKICKSLSLKLTYLTGKKIIALNKADEIIPVVSAASIVAKVIRDREIEKLHKIYGDFGSGYPSDEKTIKWLKENMEIAKRDKIVRQKWNLKIKI